MSVEALNENKKAKGDSSLNRKVYWKNLLSVVTESSRVPHDLTASVSGANDDAKAARAQLVDGMDEACFAGLWVLANRSHHSLHLILMATWGLLINKLCGLKDIVVATPGYRDDPEELSGRLLLIRNDISSAYDVRELLTQFQIAQVDALKNQSLSYEAIAEHLGQSGEGVGASLTDWADSLLFLSNIQRKPDSLESIFSVSLQVTTNDDRLEILIDYDGCHYSHAYMARVAKCYIHLLSCVSDDVNKKVSDLSLCSNEQARLIQNNFNSKPVPFRDHTPVDKLVSESAKRHPDKAAIFCGSEQITYAELERRANGVAEYLIQNKSLNFEERVGILMDRSISCSVAMLGIMKAGGAYVPIDAGLGVDRITTILDNAQIRIVFSQAEKIKLLNQLQWQTKTFDTFVCLDTDDVHHVAEREQSELMSQQLWHFIGERSTDDVTGGGWYSSYDGNPIPQAEVDEYCDNTYAKLKPYLRKETRVLEIGCATGFTMYRIAPEVGFYMGTDLSEVIIKKNQVKVDSEGIKNIKLAAMPAHAIGDLAEGQFDVIIINSVIQDFHGHNYLRQVIEKAVEKLGDKGVIFVGDVMDQDRKSDLIADLTEYKKAHPAKEVRTKLDWRAELFVSKTFFNDLAFIVDGVIRAESSDKIFTIANEFTKFRYDTILHVDKRLPIAVTATAADKQSCFQHDLSVLKQYSGEQFSSPHEPRCDGSHLAYVIFTSGSTGTPKGAMVEHRGLVNHAEAKINEMKLGQHSIVAQNASLYFDISVWQYFSALMCGGSVVIVGDELVQEPDAFLAEIDKTHVAVLEVVPSYLAVLLELIKQNKVSLRHLNYLVVTGEPLKAELVNDWLASFSDIPVINAYGPTEASDDICHHVITKPITTEKVPIGKPIQNMRVTIVDDNMNLCPVGVKGEICVSGVGVGRGYLNDPEKTSLAFLNACDKHSRVYRTGDVGAWLEDGNIEFFGRRDHQIKVRGYRIELGDIESNVRRHPAVRDAAIVAQINNGETRLVGFYVAHDVAEQADDAESLPDQIKRFLLQQLPDYMIPSVFHSLQSLPLTANGKVDRKRLLANASEMRRSDRVQPEDELEIHVRRIWADTLGLDEKDIGVTDDFFDIGGNSINVLKMANQINFRLGIKVSMGTIFLKKTIRELVVELQKEVITEGGRCIVKMNESTQDDKAFFVHAGDGTIYAYRSLAKLMADTHTVYGIQARGMVDQSELPKTAAEMIGEYLNEILKIQPEGPYIIGGICTGTFVAYELVRVLEDLGKEVSMLVMIDVPVEYSDRIVKIMKWERRIKRPGSWLLKLALKFDKCLYYAKDENIVRKQRAPGEQLGWKEWREYIYANIIQLVEKTLWPQALINSPINVICAKDNPEEGKDWQTWQKMSFGEVTFTEVPGDRDSMFYPPNVSAFHKALNLEKYAKKSAGGGDHE